MEAKNCSTDGKMKLHIRLLQTSLSEILIISAMIRVNILIETYWKGKGMYADTEEDLVTREENCFMRLVCQKLTTDDIQHCSNVIFKDKYRKICNKGMSSANQAHSLVSILTWYNFMCIANVLENLIFSSCFPVFTFNLLSI